jgi:hypothetical protein
LSVGEEFRIPIRVAGSVEDAVDEPRQADIYIFQARRKRRI